MSEENSAVLDALTKQRNDNLNKIVNSAAQNRAIARKIEELKDSEIDSDIEIKVQTDTNDLIQVLTNQRNEAMNVVANLELEQIQLLGILQSLMKKPEEDEAEDTQESDKNNSETEE